ncbi:MAG: trimethylamine methyltransferase family protein [Candidatus Brocadiia bacterium]
MSQVDYHIGGGLSREQLRRMHEAALDVLAEVGVDVSHSDLLSRVEGRTGLKVEGERVRFAPDLVEELVDEHRCRAATPAQPAQQFTVEILSGYAFQNLDAFTDELRPMGTAECIETARLVGALAEEGVVGGTPGLPQDVPEPLREVLAYRIGCEHSPTAGGAGFSSPAAARAVCRMSQVVGADFEVSVFVLSPLRVEGSTVSIALDFADRGIPARIAVYGMPILGLTTPLPLAGAFVEHVATVLAGFTLFRLLGRSEELGFKFDVYPFDMKYGTIAYGTPEHVLAYLVGAQLNDYYGVSTDACKAFHTNALRPDAHALSQRAAFGAVAALNGARRFTYGGMLGIDKIFSAEQLLYDVEIVRYLEALVRGFAFDAEALAVDAIKEVGPGGDFITHPTTLRRFRGLWSSELFPNLSPEQWQQRGRTEVKDRMRGRVRELLDGYDFALERDGAAEIERIYQAAVRELD